MLPETALRSDGEGRSADGIHNSRSFRRANPMFWIFSRRKVEEIELANQLRDLKTLRVTGRGSVSVDPKEIYRQKAEKTTASMLG